MLSRFFDGAVENAEFGMRDGDGTLWRGKARASS